MCDTELKDYFCSIEVLQISYMNVMVLKRFLSAIALSGMAAVAFSQPEAAPAKPTHFAMVSSVTNNGMSFIPTFTLGKPAAIFELSVGRRLTFDPQFRFALEGKPWSFLFWLRYDLIRQDHFQMKVGFHPALSFQYRTYTSGDESVETMVVRRYLAGELAPTWIAGTHFSAGIYYLASHGIENDITQYTHYLVLRATVMNVSLPGQLLFRVTPKVYYLKMDARAGTYAAATLGLSHKKIPLSVTSMLNKTLRSEITGTKDFSWNISLVYTFSRNFAIVK